MDGWIGLYRRSGDGSELATLDIFSASCTIYVGILGPVLYEILDRGGGMSEWVNAGSDYSVDVIGGTAI